MSNQRPLSQVLLSGVIERGFDVVRGWGGVLVHWCCICLEGRVDETIGEVALRRMCISQRAEPSFPGEGCLFKWASISVCQQEDVNG